MENKWPIEIDGLPFLKMVIFRGYVSLPDGRSWFNKHHEYYSWLAVSTHPSEKLWSSSVGMMIPNIWKNKNVPNHQSDSYIYHKP